VFGQARPIPLERPRDEDLIEFIGSHPAIDQAR
jgi:hypothetical protein